MCTVCMQSSMPLLHQYAAGCLGTACSDELNCQLTEDRLVRQRRLTTWYLHRECLLCPKLAVCAVLCCLDLVPYLLHITAAAVDIFCMRVNSNTGITQFTEMFGLILLGVVDCAGQQQALQDVSSLQRPPPSMSPSAEQASSVPCTASSRLKPACLANISA